MDNEIKNEIHQSFVLLKEKIVAINGPYLQTVDALKGLDSLKDLIFDDVVICGCEHCGQPIWESESESCTSSDFGWFCADCTVSSDF
jgi:hypothetical protein